MAWENNFDARELDAGYKIYEAGNVIHIKMADHLIEADVLDGDVDHVMIKHMGNNITAMDCECERGREGHACAHEAALLFAVEDRLEDEMRVDPHEVEDLLNFVNEQEMKDFLSILLNGDGELLKRFKKLVRYDERQEAKTRAQVEKVNEEIDAIMQGYRDDNPKYENSQVIYLSHQIADYFFGEIRQHLEPHLENFLEAHAYLHAFEVIDHMYSQLDGFYYEHASNTIKNFIRDLNVYYKRAIGGIENQDEVYQLITAHAMEKDASIFRDDYFYLLNHAFEDRYFARSLALAKQVIDSFDGKKAMEPKEEKNYEQWVLFYLRLLIRANNKKEIRILAMKNWKHINIRRFFTEYCATHDETKWLMNYIKEQIPFEKDPHSVYYDYYFLKELYKKANMRKEYLRSLDQMFTMYGDHHFEIYREIKLNSSKKYWPQSRMKYLDQIDDSEAKAYLLAIDREYDALIKMINSTSDLTEVNKARGYLKKEHPEVLVNAYKRIANNMVKKAGTRQHYKELAGILRAMIDLKGGTDQIEYLVSHYCEKYPRRKLMHEELSPLLVEAKAIDDLS